MPVTRLEDVSAQIQKFWAPIFRDELKEQTLLPSLVNKEYKGEIKEMGDTVRVSQIVRPTAAVKTIGVDADSFETTKLQTQYIDIKIDKRLVVAYEFEDLATILSQIKAQDSKVRQSLMESIEIAANNYLYGLVAPKSPDHVKTSVADFNATVLKDCRVLAGKAHWRKSDGWYALLDPKYYGDILSAQTMISSDYVPGEAPVVAGQIANRRYNFNILEDDSRADSKGLLFHPDFIHLVMGEPEIKVSDLHSNKQFGYVMSVNCLIGARLGIGGDELHITVEN